MWIVIFNLSISSNARKALNPICWIVLVLYLGGLYLLKRMNKLRHKHKIFIAILLVGIAGLGAWLGVFFGVYYDILKYDYIPARNCTVQ